MTFLRGIALIRSYSFRAASLCPIFVRISAEPVHGYLLAVCNEQHISHGTDPSITDLFKILKQQHQALKNLGPRTGEIEKILRAFSSVLDVLNPLRNKASVAHPNSTLLEEDEAMLVVNAARTLLHYLHRKFGN